MGDIQLLADSAELAAAAASDALSPSPPAWRRGPMHTVWQAKAGRRAIRAHTSPSVFMGPRHKA